MPSKLHIRLRMWPAAFVFGAALLVVTASLVLPHYVADFGIVIVAVGLLALAAAVVLFVVPVEMLPALALITFSLVPARVVPQDGPFGALPLATIILLVWGARRLLLGGAPPSQRPGLPGRRVSSAAAEWSEPFRAGAVVCGVLFLSWSLFSLVRSSDVQASTGWLVSFTAGALLPLAIRDARREADWIKRAWLMLGGWLGAYAVVEAATRSNFIWGSLYSALGLTDSQHWSVYRSEASFGHPLVVALFFAVACALAIGDWLTTSSRWTLTAAVLSGLGLVATVSRGALLAAAIAVGFAFFASMVLRGEKRWSRFAGVTTLATAGVIGVFQYDSFRARNDSVEAELSSQARDLGLSVSIQASELSGGLGSGPGTSGITGRLFDNVVIENSLLQLLISLGIPGLMLFVGLVGFAFLHALSRRAVGAASGLLAYLVCIAGFNALDAIRPMHLLLGCLLILTLNPHRVPGRVPGTDESTLATATGPRPSYARS